MLRDYRVYLFDRDDNVFAIETFRAADDSFALLKSRQVSGGGGGFELWRGGDWVARVDADGRHAAGDDGDDIAALNGLYKLEVDAGELQMVGIVNLIDGAVRGGHSTYAITGTFRCSGDTITGVVYGRRHSPFDGAYVFPLDDVRLQCQGRVLADHITGTGTAAELPNLKFNIQLTRLSS